MKKINYKKIFSLAVTFFAVPFFLNAQNFSEHILDVNWNLTPGIFSVTGNGTMVTDLPYPSFRWQVEIGFAGDVTTNPDGTTNVSGDVFGYVPANTNSLFTSGPAHLNPIGPTQFTFNMASNFQNTLWPATRYYFDIVEWHQIQQNASPVRDYEIVQTQQLQDLDLNVDDQASGQVVLTVTVPSSVNMFNSSGGVAIQGMPIDVYILTEDRPGQGIQGNENLVVWAGSAEFNSTGSATFTVPVGANLDPEEFYYVKIINGQPGAGELPLLFEDIPFLLSNGAEEEGGGNTNPGSLDSGEDFQNGLITCGQEGLPECDFEQLLLMVDKVVKFLIFVIGVPLVTLSFVYAGFLFLTSGGNSGKKEQAKEVMTNAAIGLVILLAAWLIVKTVLIAFGYTGPLLGIFGI